MFKYNEYSDLLDGTLVKPLSKMEDGSIRCIDTNGNECFYDFDDFDFDKTLEERAPSLEDQIGDIVEDENIEEIGPEPIPEPEEIEEENEEDNSSISVDELISEMEKDDSTYDGTDEEPYYEEDDNTEEVVPEDERFLNKQETEEVLNNFEIKKEKNTKYLIWRDIL